MTYSQAEDEKAMAKLQNDMSHLRESARVVATVTVPIFEGDGIPEVLGGEFHFIPKTKDNVPLAGRKCTVISTRIEKKESPSPENGGGHAKP